MKRSWLFGGIALVIALLASVVLRSTIGQSSLQDALLVTSGAFFTLAIFSFLYKDNPVYKFAEHLFVGVSAAYWMVMGFWTTLVPNLLPRVAPALAEGLGQQAGSDTINYWYLIPVLLGVFLLLRLVPSLSQYGGWAVAFLVGTTAGLNFTAFLSSNFMQQIASTMIPIVQLNAGGAFSWNLAASGPLVGLLTTLVVVFGTIAALAYFFFSREQVGLLSGVSRIGIWILMITFGASFGYTVMGRISLLVGRLNYLFGDWLGLIG